MPKPSRAGSSKSKEPSGPQTPQKVKAGPESKPQTSGDVGDVPQHGLRDIEVATQMTPELLHCPLEDWLTECTPFTLADKHVEQGLLRLRESNLLGKDNRWLDFDVLPSSMDATEDQVFSKLKKIADALGTVGYGDRTSAHFNYVNCPNITPKSEIPGGGFRFDACLHPNKSNFSSLSDASVVLEFKREKKTEDIRQNHRQVVSGANFIMNDDPRRMWMYAISIEDELMSVWHFSRSHSVKSFDFNFVECPETLVKVFLLFLFATEEEIGIDPTVHRIIDKDKKIRYIYEIIPEDVADASSKMSVANGTEGKKTKQDTVQQQQQKTKLFFKTIEAIYNPRYACISGRKTRVWKVIQVDGATADAKDIGEAEVALKDIWIDASSRSEFEIQFLINEKLKALKPKDYTWADKHLRAEIRTALSDFPKNLPLMQIECGGWGAATKSRPAKAEIDTKILFPDEPSPTPAKSGYSTNPQSTQKDRASASTGILSERAPPVNHDREFAVKRQYRLIYTQVGSSLYEAEDFCSSFMAIKDAFIALVLMFLAGWVHRDVSAGNIIVLKGADGRVLGRLSDLEYAKESDRVGEGVTDPKTGTPFFMPIEIHNGQQLSVQSRLLASEGMTNTMVPSSSRNAMPPFGAHHDLESLATWTSLWVVLCRIRHPPAVVAAPFIFSNSSVPSPYRQNLFKGLSDHATPRIEEGIHPELVTLGFPSVFQHITGALLNACLLLSTIGDPTLRKKYCETLHNDIYTQVCELQKIAASVQAVTFLPSSKVNPSSIVPSSNLATSTGKRPIKKVNDDDDDYTDGKSTSKKGKEKAPSEQIDRVETRAPKRAKQIHAQPERIYLNKFKLRRKRGLRLGVKGAWSLQTATKQHRSSLQHDLQVAIKMTLELLHLEHYLPFSPSPQFLENAYKHVKEKCLKATGRVDDETGEDEFTWGEFDEDTPSEIDGREEVVFARLETIIAVLQDLNPDKIPDGRELGFRYKNTPYDKVKSERDGAGFKWDACLRPAAVNSNDILDTDAAVIAEFKKEVKHETVRENRLQLVGSASHVINNDPCRMWIYGITIEDEQMSIWYFSRSHSVKSAPFDFTRDFKTFVHVFVSLLFATQAEMGFDPTVWRVVEANGTIRYVYQVQGRFFLTQGDAIFCPRVLCISGRRTRVWRVIEIEWNADNASWKPINEGAEYALKDVWLDEGSDTEGDILDKIFRRLDNFTFPPDCEIPDSVAPILQKALVDKRYRQYFMEIKYHQRGEFTRRVPANHRVSRDDSILDGQPIPLTPEEAAQTTRAGSTQNGPGWQYPVSAPPTQTERSYKAKQQYRLVYASVGKTIYDAPNLGSFFQAIHDASVALLMMMLANWVHRDVSTGNIILVEEKPGIFRGKLGDLEYAKEFSRNAQGSKDPKTGTPYFMPWEIHSGLTLHNRAPVLFTSFQEEDLPSSDDFPINPVLSWLPHYRFDYDLESIWWIILWTLLSRVLHGPAQALSCEVFTYAARPSTKKTDIFTQPRHPDIAASTSPHLQSLTKSISLLHHTLFSYYALDPAGLGDYLGIHGKFFQILGDMMLEVKKIGDFKLVILDSKPTHIADPLSSSSAQTGVKRPRDDDPYTDNDPSLDGNADKDVNDEAAGKSSKRQREYLHRATKPPNPAEFMHHTWARR
ncbi:hypothetical protein NP233_g915 [Leucocoprinus birnbaumii]|uniref:Fungal-type protein kinase domain-containing protein n=1 Tax=Leucocoprinus birnbaumii TaxID=56174 RepID=A0AAD5W219_9AGAR|nr:hypothetical protein NP233_g915 [Leucocoprinus birnbaumii]